jgi:hypothetical protein
MAGGRAAKPPGGGGGFQAANSGTDFSIFPRQHYDEGDTGLRVGNYCTRFMAFRRLSFGEEDTGRERPTGGRIPAVLFAAKVAILPRWPQ